MKTKASLFFFLAVLIFPALCHASNTVLTNSSPNYIITTGNDVRLYGTSASNLIILESGAKAELLNFPGQNVIEILVRSHGFTVSRSGTVVTFQGTDGTVLKIPATSAVQTIAFAGQPSKTLSIHNNKVMLDDQEIDTYPKPISAPGSECAFLSPKAQEVLEYLTSLPLKTENRVISGQFVGYASGSCVEYYNYIGGKCKTHSPFSERYHSLVEKLAEDTGKWVGMIGADYGFSDDLKEEEWKKFHDTLIDYDKNGGLITLSWHAKNPWGIIFQNGDGVKTTKEENESELHRNRFVEFVVDLTTGTKNDATEQWISQLDDIGEKLKILQDNGVVVLWRPLHEMNGDWFWWGNQAAAYYIRLWQHMYEYFTCDKFKLNNLLWVFSPNDADSPDTYDADIYYPGHDVVNIAGLDRYRTPLLLNSYQELLTSVGGYEKPIGLTEFGRGGPDHWDDPGTFTNLDLIESIKNDYPKISYFLSWHYPWSIIDNNEFKGLLDHSWVITRDEMPDLKDDPSGCQRAYLRLRDEFSLNMNTWTLSDYEEVLRIFDAGKDVDQNCQAGMGHLYATQRHPFQEQFRVLDKNNKLAVSWYEKAALKGNMYGEVGLGYMYLNGYGVEQDYTKAFEWYQKSALQGDAVAQNNLGYMYLNGYGVEQDYTKAFVWYQKSALQGFAHGQFGLGWLYEHGYGVEQDYTKAFEWYQKSALQGDAVAQNNLGYMYLNGYGVEQDYMKAFEWYQKSALQGDAVGQAGLGWLYENGYGVPKNIETAIHWYELADAQGNEYAKKAIESLTGE